MMDGFEELSETEVWAKLKIAKEACWEFQNSLQMHGFSTDDAFQARCHLTTAENQLRFHYKHKCTEPAGPNP